VGAAGLGGDRRVRSRGLVWWSAEREVCLSIVRRSGLLFGCSSLRWPSGIPDVSEVHAAELAD